ncbi:hypothetical protein CA267_003490 [Alteromonas pelagimontana]|uniref:WD40 repeat domain-containing protein n=1 Tax=Alteromonas pelagimontana TaxID=1858656 RepID=A0A6M4M9U1_9ALTE|nr:hypothetical protein [Alteromonas pelagimontana]QJR79912.1 hypothetical protein CA267_003490 [Alteromonas pelagimontana]
MKYLRIFFLLLCSSGYAYGQVSNSNLWLFSLTYNDENVAVKQAQKLTDTDSYTNQPHFLPGDIRLYYTQSFPVGASEQTDILLYDPVHRYHLPVTHTAESEYSPTPMPAQQAGFSVIRVAEDNKQWLWQYSEEGESVGKIFAVEPVGYHVWIDNNDALAFILGEPNILMRLRNDSKSQVVDEDIGPSLWAIPGTALFSYTKNPAPDTQPWTLMAYDPKLDSTTVLVTLPRDAYYVAWTHKGQALTAVGSQLLVWDFTEPVQDRRPQLGDAVEAQQGNLPSKAETGPNAVASEWQPWLNIAEYCPKGATRTAMSADNGDYLAVVCAE